jgi:VCBS repeat-containing protein
VQSLQANQVEHDVFTYQVKNAAGLVSTATLTVDVQGKNDLATISGAGPIGVDPSFSRVSSMPDVLKVQDSDSSQNTFKGVSTTEVTQFNGSYGYLELTPTGLGYQWSYTKLTNSATDTIGHDLFILESQDGTAVQTLDVQLQVKSGVTASRQEFHTQKLAGLTVMGSNATTDTFVLQGGSLMFDFTNPSSPENISSISSVEKIDITGTGNNTIKLNIASVTQADMDQSIHKLYITGDAGDVVDLVKPTGWDPSSRMSTRDVNHVMYNVYQLSAEHELLINSAITNITFS